MSFYVHNIVVAEDLVKWFETGYTFIIDADRSPGEIEPNRYLVFVEIKRRTQLIEQMKEMLEDFNTLTDLELKDEIELNEMRLASGLPHKNIYNSTDDEMNHFRTLAHLPVKK